MVGGERDGGKGARRPDAAAETRAPGTAPALPPVISPPPRHDSLQHLAVPCLEARLAMPSGPTDLKSTPTCRLAGISTTPMPLLDTLNPPARARMRMHARAHMHAHAHTCTRTHTTQGGAVLAREPAPHRVRGGDGARASDQGEQAQAARVRQGLRRRGGGRHDQRPQLGRRLGREQSAALPCGAAGPSRGPAAAHGAQADVRGRLRRADRPASRGA